MALKIEFSSGFKDADTIIRTLQELNREFDHMKDSASAVGQSGSKSFSDLGRSIQSFDQLTKSTKTVKDFTESLKQITGSNSDMIAFSRSFNDFGRAVNAGLGDASSVLLKQLKANIASIRGELERNVGDAKAAHDLLKESRTDEERDFLRHERAKSSVLADEAQRRTKEAQRVVRQYSPLNERFGINLPGIGQLSTAEIGNFIKGIGARALPIIGGGYEALQAYTQAYNYSPARAEATRRQLIFEQASQVQQGNLTVPFLQMYGAGQEQRIRKGGLAALPETASIYAHGLATDIAPWLYGIGAGAAFINPLVGAGIIGAGKLASMFGGGKNIAESQETTYYQARQLDLAENARLSQGLKNILDLQQGDQEETFRMYGEKGAESLLQEGRLSGISNERMIAAMKKFGYYGINPATMYSFGSQGQQLTTEAANLVDIQRLLGVTPEAAQQAYRAYQRGSPAFSQMADVMGKTGLTDRAAMTVLSGGIAQAAGQFGGQFDIAQAGGAVAAAAAAAQQANVNTGVSQVETAQAAVTAANTARQSAGNYHSIEYFERDKAIIDMGINDPTLRATLNQLIANQDYKTAYGYISAITGKPVAEVQKRMEGTTRRVLKMQGQMFAGAQKQLDKARAKNPALTPISELGFMRFGNIQAAEQGTEPAYEAATLAQTGVEQAGPAAPQKGRMDLISDVMNQAKAQQQQGENRAYQDVLVHIDKIGTTLYQVIADSLRNAGDEVARQVENLEKQHPVNGPVTGTTKPGNNFQSRQGHFRQ